MNRYRHWDYWVSTLAAAASIMWLTLQILTRVRAGCVTFGDIGVIVGLGLVTFAAVGWNVHVVLDKYPDYRK